MVLDYLHACKQEQSGSGNARLKRIRGRRGDYRHTPFELYACGQGSVHIAGTTSFSCLHHTHPSTKAQMLVGKLICPTAVG